MNSVAIGAKSHGAPIAKNCLGLTKSTLHSATKCEFHSIVIHKGAVVSRSATIVAVAIIVMIACGSSYAADMAPEPVYKASAPVVAPVPTYTWTGIYFGVNGGYGFGQSTPMSLYSSDFSAFNYNANGWLGGLTAGAQLQVGHTVMGFEADIDWANITGSATGPINFNGAPIGSATLSSTLSSISTARARVGYAYENWLFYATAGLALTNEKSTLTWSRRICLRNRCLQ